MVLQVVLLTIAALLAVVAVTAAVIATRAVREMKELRESQSPPEPTPTAEPYVSSESTGVSLAKRRAQRDGVEVEYEVIEGKVMVQATPEQAIAAIMTQPRIRAAIWVSGLAHALRPESRDRIFGLMRREVRTRRRARQRAARAAARSVVNP